MAQLPQPGKESLYDCLRACLVVVPRKEIANEKENTPSVQLLRPWTFVDLGCVGSSSPMEQLKGGVGVFREGNDLSESLFTRLKSSLLVECFEGKGAPHC